VISALMLSFFLQTSNEDEQNMQES